MARNGWSGCYRYYEVRKCEVSLEVFDFHARVGLIGEVYQRLALTDS